MLFLNDFILLIALRWILVAFLFAGDSCLRQQFAMSLIRGRTSLRRPT